MYLHITDLLGENKPWVAYKVIDCYISKYKDQTPCLCVQFPRDKDGAPVYKYFLFRDGIVKWGDQYLDDAGEVIALERKT